MERKEIIKRFGLFADIRETIFRIPFLTEAVNSFRIDTPDDSFIIKKFKICFELKENLSFIELNLVHCDMAKKIVREMQLLNREIKESFKILSFTTEPGIEFYSMGHGPFRDSILRIKNRFSA